MDVTNDIELYESDRPKIVAVAQHFASRIGTYTTAEALAVDITGRFEDAGYRVDLVFGVQDQAGTKTFLPHVRIVGRVEPEAEYDYERQAREVQAAEGVTLRDTGSRSNLWVPGHPN